MSDDTITGYRIAIGGYAEFCSDVKDAVELAEPPEAIVETIRHLLEGICPLTSHLEQAQRLKRKGAIEALRQAADWFDAESEDVWMREEVAHELRLKADELEKETSP
jgi:hypothetical protein